MKKIIAAFLLALNLFVGATNANAQLTSPPPLLVGGTGVTISTSGNTVTVTNSAPYSSAQASSDLAAVYHPVDLIATSASLGGSALLAGACTTGTVTVTGAATGMFANLNATTWPGDGTSIFAYVSAANTVTIKICADVALTPGASTYIVRVQGYVP